MKCLSLSLILCCPFFIDFFSLSDCLFVFPVVFVSVCRQTALLWGDQRAVRQTGILLQCCKKELFWWENRHVKQLSAHTHTHTHVILLCFFLFLFCQCNTDKKVSETVKKTVKHTLDLLISRGLNISSIVIKDVALSDHFCIFFDIMISVTTESRSVSVRKRCINENTSVLFMKAISLTPSISADSVDLLLDSFNSKVKNVIDDIAPIKVSKKNGRQKSFWRKSTAVQNMKRQCRKAERMWRKTKLEIHYSIYKDSLHAFNLELATARQTFFSNLINSNLNNTRTLFATAERLTNPPSQIPSEMLSDSKCNEFASFFSEKISNIRKEIGTSSCNTEVTQIRQQSQKEGTMSVFEAIDSKILEEIVQHLKSSTCYLDTLPTSFFKSVLNCLEADPLEVVNTSLLSGTFPNSLKTAVVKPLLKKRNLDNTMLSNYRPISNLPFIGKIIEKVVFNQLNNYLTSNGYLDNFQSGFRVHHSTETALIKIINDIRFNSDSGKISVLVLLDLSAAFDTVDHNILLERLENWVGLSGMALKWFRSYLEGRGYYVSIGEHKSKWTSMTCGVPQGSILAPLLFSLYMLPLSQIMRKNQIAYHSYADDTQIYLALSPNDYSPIDSLCQCIDEINSWMCQNFLQLNKEKTEVIAFGNKDEVLKVNAYLDSRGQTTKNQVRNLGVILVTDLSFSSHVKAVTKSAYYHLKNIARIRCFVSSQDLEKLVHAFITAGWIIVMVSSPAFQRRPLDSCSSSRTLLPGFWLEPENLSISHQSSGPYTGFQLHLGLILKYFYSFINHSMA